MAVDEGRTIHNSLYAEIVDYLIEILPQKGKIKQSEALKAVHCARMALPTISWEYIRGRVEGKLDDILIPAPPDVFKRERWESKLEIDGVWKFEREVFPRRFIAGGRGRPTVGYLLGSHDGTPQAIAYYMRTAKSASNKRTKAQSMHTRLVRNGALPSPDDNVPQLTQDKNEADGG